MNKITNPDTFYDAEQASLNATYKDLQDMHSKNPLKKIKLLLSDKKVKQSLNSKSSKDNLSGMLNNVSNMINSTEKSTKTYKSVLNEITEIITTIENVMRTNNLSNIREKRIKLYDGLKKYLPKIDTIASMILNTIVHDEELKFKGEEFTDDIKYLISTNILKAILYSRENNKVLEKYLKENVKTF